MYTQVYYKELVPIPFISNAIDAHDHQLFRRGRGFTQKLIVTENDLSKVRLFFLSLYRRIYMKDNCAIIILMLTTHSCTNKYNTFLMKSNSSYGKKIILNIIDSL